MGLMRFWGERLIWVPNFEPLGIRVFGGDRFLLSPG